MAKQAKKYENWKPHINMRRTDAIIGKRCWFFLREAIYFESLAGFAIYGINKAGDTTNPEYWL